MVFFPSFSFTEQACSHWQRSGALAAVEKHKRVIRWFSVPALAGITCYIGL